ncbi:MAG: hypothetical protein OJF62_001174 [Pseudolabrys sp.]|nr:hypothetical protein [Pseudolabrys sp.]
MLAPSLKHRRVAVSRGASHRCRIYRPAAAELRDGGTPPPATCLWSGHLK